MENPNNMKQRNIVDELTQGRELATQLKNEIGLLTSKETCEQLLQKIVFSYDKALACLNLTELLQKDLLPIVDLIDSPESSPAGSPKIGCPKVRSPRDVFKKRKTLARRSEQIKVCSGTEHEGPPDDGHSWRKYGQKDILGATHPRAYYRCTHKPTRGCVATKQVQKMEEDPLIYEVTYRGNHTCMDVLNNLQQQPKQKQNQNIPFKFGQGLAIESKEINSNVEERIPSFSFPSTSVQPENQDICWEQFDESNILAGLESPETMESNYFSGSTCQVLPYNYDLTDTISTITSGTNSTFHLDMDPVEMNIEPNLSFNVLDYFIPDMVF